MSAPKLKKARGLYTATNRYDVPEGALVTANNILILKDGVIQPRWGLVASATSMVTGNVSHWHRASELNGTLWYAGRDTVANTCKIGYASPTAFAGVTVAQTEDGPDGYANFTSSSAVPYFDVEFVKAGNLLYYNPTRGMQRIESTSTQRYAGGFPCAVSCFPRPLSCAAGYLTTAGGVTTAVFQIAHGYVPGLKIKMTSAGEANFAAGEYTVATVPDNVTITYAAGSGTHTSGSEQIFAAEQFVGSSGFVPTTARLAYRALIVEYDSNGNKHVGEVSGRVVVDNASPFVGAADLKNVQLAVIFQPTVLGANSKLELYRTQTVTPTGSVPDPDPGDEMGLTYSKYLTAAEIAQGFVWVTDITPNLSLSTKLYINEQQDGAKQNNARSAPCKTIALWKDRLVQANTFDFPQLNMQLKSVDSSSGGLVAGDVIWLPALVSGSTRNLTALASTSGFTTGDQFSIYTGGTAQTDAKHTVLSLIDVINWNTSTDVAVLPLADGLLASYTAVGDDWPGRFNLKLTQGDQNDPTSAAYKIRGVFGKPTGTSTRDCFSPKLGVYATVTAVITRAANSTSFNTVSAASIDVGEDITLYSDYTNQTVLTIQGTAVSGKVTSVSGATVTIANTGTNGTSNTDCVLTSTYRPLFENNHQKNNLIASKPLDFEAFPPFNYVRIGSPEAQILKCVPCKDSLMVFKEDGLFRVTASGAYGESLSAELVDPNAILWAKDTAVAIDGRIMAWLTKGVAIINEQGVEKYVSKGRIDDRLAPTTTKTSEPDLLAYPFSRRAQAFVDEKRNLYELRICLSSGPSAPYASTINLVYNIDEDAWFEDDLAVVSEVFYQGKRYIQQSTSFYAQDNQVYGGLGTGVLSTFAASITNNVFAFTYTGSIAVGSVIDDQDVTTQYYVLTASGGNGTIYNPLGTLPSVPTNYNIYAPVVSTIKWAPVTFGEENKLKRHKELEILFGVREMMAAELTTTSEQVTTGETVTHKLGTVATSVGVNGFAPYNMRQIVPQQHRVGQQLSVQLVIRTAYGAWTLLGIGCDADVLGPRVNRGNL